MQRFQIAGIVLELQTQMPICITKPFEPFQTEEKPDYVIHFKEVNRLPNFPTKIMYQGDCFEAAELGNKAVRCFVDSTRKRESYAIGIYDWDRKRAEIMYLPRGLQVLNESGNCFFHIAWESILLREKRMVLHSCCIKTEMGGILFSGISGIGKSTQGNLWCEYENAWLINGDRSILYREDNIWRGAGSPYAGSSRCYKNESVSVRAIVMLQQASSCTIRRMGTAEAFHKIYAQLTINDWDAAYVDSICSLTEQLISDIPVYELSCTPNRTAVELLKATLEREK